MSDFFDDLMHEVTEHPALRHPFLERFAAGPELQHVRRFAVQHYAYSRMFTRNLAAVISNTPDERARQLLAINIYEEIGEPLHTRDHAFVLLQEGLISSAQLAAAAQEEATTKPRLEQRDVVAALIRRNVVSREQVAAVVERRTKEAEELAHAALFRRFLRAVDAHNVDVPLPATDHFVREINNLCRAEHWLKGLGALGPGTECIVPTIYRKIIAGLEKSKVVIETDYVFWTIHVHCDDGHGQNIIDAMRPYSTTAEARDHIRFGALGVLEARAKWMDGLLEHVFGGTGEPS